MITLLTFIDVPLLLPPLLLLLLLLLATGGAAEGFFVAPAEALALWLLA
jgi:hypothetical protein